MRTLVCFPFAGSGASFFRSWAHALRDEFRVLPIQLPGRENRLGEEPYLDVSQAINSLQPEIDRLAGDGGEIFAFGHSLGAVLAYEFALRLRDLSPGCQRLFVSGSPGPSRLRAGRATGLNDGDFLDQVRSFAGYSHPALDDPEMRELLLPMIRADVEMHENYRASAGAILDIPVTCVRGREDDLVSREDVAAWQGATNVPIEIVEVSGGHMYVAEDPGQLFGLFMSSALAA